MTNGPTIINQTAWEIGILAQRLVAGYYTHMAALYVAADSRAGVLAPGVEPGQMVPVLRVPRDDGTYHVFHFSHFLAEVSNPQLAEDFKRAWLANSLLMLGDKLGEAGYYNRAPDEEPEAELVRHLRNGIAHGNKFRMRGKDIVDPKTARLRCPAHNRRYTKALTMREYVVDTDLNGTTVLFDYGGPATVLDILTALGWHLTRTAHGFSVGTA